MTKQKKLVFAKKDINFSMEFVKINVLKMKYLFLENANVLKD